MTCRLQRLAAAIAAHHGLIARGDWHALIVQALETMDVADDDLSEPLNPRLIERVAGALTVPETFFMRHHTQLERVADHLAERLSGGKAPLGVLSAGCSTGEEPYSLVLCLMRRLNDYRPGEIAIRACDISPEAIAKASRACYGSWSFRDVPAWLLERHFQLLDGGRHQLSDDVRERVTFRRGTIADQVGELGDGSTDVVLFRNVGIYLSEEHLTHLYREYRRILRRDGLLVVAPSDPRPPRALFERTDHESTGVYCCHEERASQAPGERVERRHVRPRAGGIAARKGDAPAPCAGTPESGSIRALADAGEVRRAVQLAEARARMLPSDPEAHLLLGQLYLGGARAEDGAAAIEHIRRAVFLSPEHAVGRFWYAHALIGAGQLRKALRQLDALGRILDKLPEELRFEEAGVSVAELREARKFLVEGVQ